MTLAHATATAQHVAGAGNATLSNVANAVTIVLGATVFMAIARWAYWRMKLRKPFEVFIKLSGSSDLVQRIPEHDDHNSGQSGFRWAQIEVGIVSRVRRDLKATLNVLIPAGLGSVKTDHAGLGQNEGGKWMPPTPEVIGPVDLFDYWAERIELPATDATLRFFNIRFDSAGPHPVRVKINSAGLDREFVSDVVVTVVVAAQETAIDRVSDLIYEGDGVLAELDAHGISNYQASALAAQFHLSAANACREVIPGAEELLTAAKGSLRGSHVEQLESRIKAQIAALYGIRRRAGKP